MKKIIVWAVVFALVLAVAFVLVACDNNGVGGGNGSGGQSGNHDHQWSAWQWSTEMEDSNQTGIWSAWRERLEGDDSLRREIREHLYNGEHYRVCSICGDIEYQSHQWGESYPVPVDETPDGVVSTCTVCGGTGNYRPLTFAETYSFDETAHWYACTTPGYEHLKREYRKHYPSGDGWTIEVQPTATESGVEVMHCYYCDEDIRRTIDISDGSACEPFLSFELNADGASYAVAGFAGNQYPYTTLVIPTMHEGKPVTVVGTGTGVMADSNVTEVVLPSSVTKIAGRAFSNYWKLERINLGDVVEIGNEAFYYCPITEADFSSVTTIGTAAFARSDLQEVSLGANVILGERAFSESRVQTVTVDCDIPAGAFYYCRYLHHAYINSTTIGSGAFSRCSMLMWVTLLSNVATIESQAFIDCCRLVVIANDSDLNLTPGNAEHGGIAKYAMFIRSTFVLNQQNLLRYDEYSHTWSLVYGADAETQSVLVAYDGDGYDVAFPYVTRVHAFAFFGYYNLDSVSIVADKIEDNAFACDGGLQFMCEINSLTLDVKEIEPNAFRWDGIGMVTVADGCTDYVMRDGALFSADLSTMVHFFPQSGVTELVLPEETTTVYARAISANNSLKKLTINSDITVAGGFMVYEEGGDDNGAPALEEIVFGNDVTVVPAYLVYGCSSLKKVEFGDKVTEIKSHAFVSCRLREITIPASLTVCHHAMFEWFSKLETIRWNAVECYVATDNDYGDPRMYNLREIILGEDVRNVCDYLTGLIKMYPNIAMTAKDGLVYLGSDTNAYKALVDIDRSQGTPSWDSVSQWTIAEGCEVVIDDFNKFCDDYSRKGVIIIVPVSVHSYRFAHDYQWFLYYKGTPSEMANNQVTYDENYGTVYFYSETEPTDTSRTYWHYDDEGSPVVWQIA